MANPNAQAPLELKATNYREAVERLRAARTLLRNAKRALEEATADEKRTRNALYEFIAGGPVPAPEDD